MARNNNSQRPRRSLAERSGKKVPLTFYRSGQAKPADAKSPFEGLNPTKQKGNKLLSRLLDSAILIAFLFLLVYSLLVATKPNILLNSEAYRSKNIYENAAVEELKKLKNRNKFTLSEKDIADSLQKKFPEITTVEVELPIFSQTPKLRINVAKPSFVLSSDGKQYLINSKGVAVDEVSEFSSVKDLPVVNDKTGFEVSAGKQVLSEDNVRFMNTLIAHAKKSNIPIASLSLPPFAQELDLNTTDKPYYVKFYLGGDVSTQVGQFLSTRKQLEQSKTQPSEYLDVRVNGKIFYK